MEFSSFRIFAPIVENVKLDAWIKEDPFEPPVAILMFIFSSL